MSSDELDLLLDRAEVLAGLPTKRADTAIFLIESRTSHLVVRARHAAERFTTGSAARERDMQFVEAFSLGQEPARRPSIQELERYSNEWASLVPQSPRVRAAIAKRLGERYQLVHPAIPGVRSALGLDTAEVQTAYRRLYGESLETIFASRVSLLERLQWRKSAVAAKLEGLSPFWTSFSLTLTETVGASILALPIALAALGPVGGALTLMLIGIVNIITVAYMAEAVARTGSMRYGGVYIGSIVRNYLGPVGSVILSSGLLLLFALILPAFFMGVATTIQDAIGLIDVVGVAIIFLTCLYFLRRKSLNATVASALVIGALNLLLIVTMCALALGHLKADNFALAGVPILGGGGFDVSILGLVFGVVMASYFGHTSVVLCGRLVLDRDPSGRALMRGCVAAQATAMAVYCVFVVVVNGSIGKAALLGESGTVLVPLAAEVGPILLVFGSIFAVLGMGMGSIHFSLAMFNLVRERLPLRPSAPDAVALSDSSLMSLLQVKGLQAELLAWITRRGEITAAEAAQLLETTRADVERAATDLLRAGLIVESMANGESRFSARLVRRGRTALSDEIWEAMDVAPPSKVQQRVQRVGLGPTSTFLLSSAPVAAAFLAAEWMLVTDSGTFAGLLGFVGVIAVTLLTGIFPVLLLTSSRRKGERPSTQVYFALGNRVVLAVFFVLFLAAIALHGLVIWEHTWERVGALVVAGGVLVITFAIWRRGGFAPRATVEVRSDLDEGRTLFEVTTGGRGLPSMVELNYGDHSRTLTATSGEIPMFERLQSAIFSFGNGGDGRAATELKLWVHEVGAETGSHPITTLHSIRVGTLAIPGAEESVLPFEAGDSIELGFGSH